MNGLCHSDLVRCGIAFYRVWNRSGQVAKAADVILRFSIYW